MSKLKSGTVEKHLSGHVLSRNVPDPDSTIRYPVKCRHPALSGKI